MSPQGLRADPFRAPFRFSGLRFFGSFCVPFLPLSFLHSLRVCAILGRFCFVCVALFFGFFCAFLRLPVRVARFKISNTCLNFKRLFDFLLVFPNLQNLLKYIFYVRFLY